ncbi:major facilitator superfamily transporter multidrug resistance [Niveomyces insectorum RCEF 264]|uniref:Major facilitator superfamily transporter multidrug resistance n=1 Tax=Niveomyces insectorum RCEF 264 TaxID=1081102 RepID=A0A168A0V6_9HYPO|nr:major facilitator superfamily transporter multidrug resistance [Niveomyces insectorum RCEF 264]
MAEGDEERAGGQPHHDGLDLSPPSTGGLTGSTRAGEPRDGEDSTDGGTPRHDGKTDGRPDEEEFTKGAQSASDLSNSLGSGEKEEKIERAPRKSKDADVDEDAHDKAKQQQDAAKEKKEDGGGGDNDDDDDDDDEADDEGAGTPPMFTDEAGAGVQAAEIAYAHSRSRPSSTFSRTPTVVPRSQRRGLFGRFAILPEIERPYEYDNKTKWTITLIVSLTGAAGPLGSAIFYPALAELSIDFHASHTVTNLTIALYMLAMSIFPLWWSSFSETLGRRSVYIVSFSLFVVFSVLNAVSTSIGMLIAMRVLGGGASASVQAVGAGTLADIWEPHERGRAMGIFYLGPLTGPLFAPIIGGALSQHWGWKSTMWFLTIYGGLIVVMIFFCLPETLHKNRLLPPELRSRPAPAAAGAAAGVAAIDADGNEVAPDLTRMATARSVRMRTQRLGSFLKHAFVHPLSVLLYLRYPPIMLTVVYGAVTFGSLFVLNVTVQAAFSSKPYQFSELIVGLMYIPGSLGYITASLLGGRWIDNIMAREARKAGRYDANGKLLLLPEDRMRENAWLSASLFPGALIWFGWTVQHGVFWLVPSISNFFFGVGSMLVFGAVTTMLTEFMPQRSSGGIALNNFLRNIFSCVGALVAQPLIDAMGYGWLCTMVALIAFFIGNMCIFLLRRYGPGWRKAMDERQNKQP